MGLLGNLVNKVYTNVLDPFTTIVSHPIKSIQAAINPDIKFKDVVSETIKEPKGQQIVEVLSTALTVGSIYGAGKAIATKGITTAAKALIPSTTKGKIVAGGTTLLGAGILAETKKPIQAVSTLPSNIGNFGSNVGKLIDNPTLLQAEKTLKENPLISSIVLGTGAAIVGKGATSAFGAVSSYQTKKAVDELSSTIKQNNTANNLLPSAGEIALRDTSTNEVASSTNSFIPQTAVTPATTQMTTTKTGISKRKTYKKQQLQNISQKVNVVLGNKTYINRRTYIG